MGEGKRGGGKEDSGENVWLNRQKEGRKEDRQNERKTSVGVLITANVKMKLRKTETDNSSRKNISLGRKSTSHKPKEESDELSRMDDF